MEKRLKTHRLVVRCGPSEKELVEKAAADTGASVSAFILAKVWAKPAPVPSGLFVEVGEVERRTIEAMAEKAGQSVSDFIMARVWGEVGDQPSALPDPSAEGERASRLNLLLAIPGVKLGAQQLDSGAFIADPIEHAAPKARRAFNLRRSQWYALVEDFGWCQLLRDHDTGQLWVNASGSAQEFETEAVARAFIASKE